ncbi:neuronatin isoform X2 [Callorhinus ursinus]|uniref:Neuronatin isoform X2 n=1 Tax=Zalophus californianus TaxID=9704 RepID=A0A6J2FEB0_ZALCA|nr:neuronatin isoform X2 [Zalophus californianus]
MAAVAAASAELLIIGWYIFRVLLQTLPILIAAIPACPSAAVGTACPRAFPAPSSSRRPFPVRPRPAGNKELGRGGRQPLTIAEALSDQRGVPGMLHLLGRIRFSKSSRDTAHCEK